MAQDADAGDNGIVRYRLLYANHGGLDLFTVNATSGDLSIKKSLSENYQPSYSLTVAAQDQASPETERR